MAPLRAVPRFTGEVSRWLHDEWYRDRGDALSEVHNRLRAGCARRRFPETFVACDGGRPVGSFTLEETGHPLTGLPVFCLSNVVVDAAWRGRGVGRRLCAAAVERTVALGIPRLSLLTVSHADWYAGMGWRCVEIVATQSAGRDELAFLMQRDVAPRRRLATSRRTSR